MTFPWIANGVRVVPAASLAAFLLTGCAAPSVSADPASPPGQAPSRQASPLCGPYPDVAGAHADLSGEVPAWRGLDSRGWVSEILLAPDGSWVRLRVFPDGLACLVAVGQAGVAVKPATKGPGL